MKKSKKKQEQKETQKGWCSLEVRCDEDGVKVKVEGRGFDPLSGMLDLAEGAAKGVASLAAAVGMADAKSLAEIMADAFASTFKEEFVCAQKKLGR